MTLIKKLILSLLTFTLLFTGSASYFFASPAKAQGSGVIDAVWGTGPWYNQSFGQFITKVVEKGNEDEIFGERYTFAQVDWIITSVIMWPFVKLFSPEFFNCIFTGDMGQCVATLITSKQGGSSIANLPEINTPNEKATYNKKSLLSAIFEDRGLSGVTYVKGVISKISLVPEVDAQGFGFNFGFPTVIQDFWRNIRDITYAIFVLITIVIAFMIMFRVKLSPQMVISVQSALPKIIITLILITFSYAIAGFLIDLMYVFYGLIAMSFGGDNPTGLFYLLTRGFSVTVANTTLWAGALGYIFVYVFLFFAVALLIFFSAGGIFSLLSAALSAILVALLTLFSNGTFAVILFIVFLLILLAIFIFLLIHGVRIMWLILRTYTNIVLLTIFSPIFIAIGALTNAIGIGRWLRMYISSLAVFVVISFLFYMSFRFLVVSMDLIFSQYNMSNLVQSVSNLILGTAFTGIVSGQISPDWPPLVGGGNNPTMVAFLFMGVSFVLFAIIPNAANMIQSLLSGRPFAFGTAVGEAFGPTATITRGVTSGVIGRYEESVGRQTALGSVLRTLGVIRR